MANYTGGSYAVIRIKPDGSLGETTDVVKPGGPMRVYNAKDKPPGMFGTTEPHGTRGHMILPDPTGQYVLGADAGRDQIFVWKLDANTGKLTPGIGHQVGARRGAAPFRFLARRQDALPAAGTGLAPDGLWLCRWQADPERAVHLDLAGRL